MVVVLVVFAILGALIAWGLLKTGYALREQACINRVMAQYPAVSVSAYNSERSTGALKLSYDAERRAAVRDC
jgi:type II secretory pathway pseudopilin PulG